jgi:hypothetical protein
LPGISTEQLRSRLNRMVADGLLTRQRYREVPPRVDYELTERSRELLPVLGALARWGYDWTWGAPRPGELVAIGAVLRLAPGLMSPAPSVEGIVECVVSSATEEERSYFLRIADGEATIAERAVEVPDARVAGPTRAWVRALSPGGTLDGLTISGARGLAEAVLGPFLAAAARGRERDEARQDAGAAAAG